MGKFSKGMFGNFYGKIGQLVGSSWRGIDYLRSLPRINKNRQPTAAQLEQQMRFSMMTAFLNPIRDLFDIGYRNAPSTATTYNHALAENVRTAITGVYPDLAIDFSQVQLSRGALPVGAEASVLAAAGRELQFRWLDNSGKLKAVAKDLAVALVYCPELKDAEYSVGRAIRSDQSLSMSLPAEFAGREVETWIFWTSANGKNITATVYTGPAIVLA